MICLFYLWCFDVKYVWFIYIYIYIYVTNAFQKTISKHNDRFCEQSFITHLESFKLNHYNIVTICLGSPYHAPYIYTHASTWNCFWNWNATLRIVGVTANFPEVLLTLFATTNFARLLLLLLLLATCEATQLQQQSFMSTRRAWVQALPWFEICAPSL
jgi:hypothetical protein